MTVKYAVGMMMLGSLSLSGQSLVSSSGGTYSSGTVSIEFGLGEPIIETVHNSHTIVTQGFLQPVERMATGVLNFKEGDVEVYPNPAVEQVFIESTSENLVNCRLFAANGREVLQVSDIGQKNGQMSITKLPSGIYFLTIETQSGKKTFRKINKQ